MSSMPEWLLLFSYSCIKFHPKRVIFFFFFITILFISLGLKYFVCVLKLRSRSEIRDPVVQHQDRLDRTLGILLKLSIADNFVTDRLVHLFCYGRQKEHRIEKETAEPRRPLVIFVRMIADILSYL